MFSDIAVEQQVGERTLMATVRARIRVADDGTITGKAEGALPPGEYEATIDVVEQPKRPRAPLNLRTFDVGPWPADLPLRREEMYGDDGR